MLVKQWRRESETGEVMATRKLYWYISGDEKVILV
jgi:hypothetical protein